MPNPHAGQDREMLDAYKIGIEKIDKDCDLKRYKVVAIAYNSSGKVIVVECNRSAEGQISKFSTHAEEFLVRKLRRIKAVERLGPISVVVMRLTPTGPAMSKPCKYCEQLLNKYGIDEIYYSSREGWNRL